MPKGEERVKWLDHHRIPLNLKIADELQKEIENGLYGPGEKLPSESSLCHCFHTNRYTVRQALDRLVQVGMIQSRQGMGYYVRPKLLEIQYNITPVTRFSQVIRNLGRIPSAEVLSAEVIQVPQHVANVLFIEEKEQVIRMTILRFADEVPLTINTTWLPYKMFPNFLEKAQPFDSLYGLLERAYGIFPKRMRSTFQSTFPTAYEAVSLNISSSTPLLQIQSIVRDTEGRRIEYTVAKYRGDLCSVSIHFDDEGTDERTDEGTNYVEE